MTYPILFWLMFGAWCVTAGCLVASLRYARTWRTIANEAIDVGAQIARSNLRWQSRALKAESQISDILARLESGEEFAVEVSVLDDGTRQLQGLTTTQVGDRRVH